MCPAESVQPSLLVMAAGIGSRYGGLKQIDPVGPSGEIIIEYAIYDALRAGFGRVVFVIRRAIEKDFRNVIEPHFAGRVPIAYAFQELDDLPSGFTVPADRAKPWGTAHAILSARDLLDGPFGVINADDFYGRRSYKTLAQHLAVLNGTENRFCLVGFTLRNTLSEHGSVARGICRIDKRGRLKEVVERLKIERDGDAARYQDGDQWHPLTGDETVSMNMWGFTPSIFPHIEREFRAFLPDALRNPKAECLIPTVSDGLIRNGLAEFDVLTTDETWLGVTYPADKPRVAAGILEQVSAGLYPTPLWNQNPNPGGQP